jgi:membrane-bound metal-dependent hydrolase YbcI (DUF457 family)
VKPHAARSAEPSAWVRRAAALGSLATIAVADYVIARHRPRWLVAGLFDHPAHLATAALVQLNLAPRSRAWSVGFVAGALAPDLDHVPLALRKVKPSLDDARPLSHCLLAVAPVAALARSTGAEPVAGLTAGMLAHFLRDLGVGTGVPLLWPATERPVAVPYTLYAAGCLALGVRATLKPGL